MAAVYPSQPTAVRPSLWKIISVFARDANLTFGGGGATAEALRRELVERRRWLTGADFRVAYSASRLTPATNLLAICTAMGWQIRGTAGALAALLAASIPSSIVVATMMAAYERAASYSILKEGLRGAIAVSVALLVSSAWALACPQLKRMKRFRAVTILIGSIAAVGILGASPLAVLVGAGLIGAVRPEHEP